MFLQLSTYFFILSTYLFICLHIFHVFVFISDVLFLYISYTFLHIFHVFLESKKKRGKKGHNFLKSRSLCRGRDLGIVPKLVDIFPNVTSSGAGGRNLGNFLIRGEVQGSEET